MDLSITIRGVTPLLMNRFTDEAQLTASAATRGTFVGDRGTGMEQAGKRLYLGEDGKIGIPQPNVLRMLVDAGKFFKNGRTKITTQASSLITSCVDVGGFFLPIDHAGWKVDTRPVRIPATGGRILCHRPMFEVWALPFDVELDTEEISENLLREIVDKAGRAIGLGDFRPDRKGPFGKFVVDRWERAVSP